MKKSRNEKSTFINEVIKVNFFSLWITPNPKHQSFAAKDLKKLELGNFAAFPQK